MGLCRRGKPFGGFEDALWGGVAGEDVGGVGEGQAGVHGAHGVDGGDVAAQAVVGAEQVDAADVGDGHDDGLVGGGGAEDAVTPDAEHAAPDQCMIFRNNNFDHGWHQYEG